MSHKKNIWMVVYHPQEVVYAIAISKLIKKQSFCINLIAARHGYWTVKVTKKLKKHFSSIIFIDPPKRPAGLDTNLIITKFIKPLFKAWSQIKKLPIQKQDKIICFSNSSSLINNLVISIYSHSTRIYIGSDYKFRFDLNKRSTGNILITSIYKFFHFLFNLYPLNYYPGFDSRPRLNTYKQKLSEIHDHVFITKNITLKQFASNEIPYPQIILRPLVVKNKQNKVYLFGSDIHLKDNQKNITIVNQILNFLRHHYPNCQLVYFPHPIETVDKKTFNLKKFTINRNSAQAMFLEKSENILAVYSYFSTASLAALNYGFNTYSFLKLFDTSKDPGFKHRYQEYYSKVPSGFYIKNLSLKPKPYISNKEYSTTHVLIHQKLKRKITTMLKLN